MMLITKHILVSHYYAIRVSILITANYNSYGLNIVCLHRTKSK